MTDRLNVPRVAAGCLFTLAGLLAVSIAFSFLAAESQNLIVILLRLPSRFLVASFHLASLYVPAVLLAAGLLVISRAYRHDHLWLLLASMVPFFTAATLVRLIANARIADSPLTAALSGLFGRVGAASLAIVFLLIEGAGFILVWMRRPRPISGGTPRITALLAAPIARPTDAQPIPASLIDLPKPPSDELSVFFSGGEFAPDARTLDDEDEDEYDDEEFERALEGNDVSDEFEDELDEAFDDEEVEAELDRAWDEPSLEPGEAPRPVTAWASATPTSAAQAAVSEAAPTPEPAFVAPATPVPAPVPNGFRYDVPVAGLLTEYGDQHYWTIDQVTRDAAETLRITLEEFGIQAEVTGIRKGPVITMFEILPAPGVKLSKIVNLSDNIALRLAASSVRIVAPIPGKHAVGIEIPNRERSIVGFAELLQDDAFNQSRMEIPIALGKDIPGDAQIVDLTRMPHVLIAGATGSGKSVCVNSIICSILYRRAPHEVKLILIDPKIVELKFYNDIPHLLTPVITDPKRAFQALQYCIYEMERRYSLLDALQVRDIQSYNRKIRAKDLATEPIPYIVVVVDEFADLMATSGKELESTLARLAAMSRAVGIHLVLATQRPSTDVITGLIKANIPSRIAFMVASKIDSRIILDAMGADKLLGRGDMLFTSAWDPFPIRMQGAFLSEDDVERVVTYVKQLGEPEYIDDEIFVEDDDEEYAQGELEDPLMEKAIEIVTTAGKASASYLQRRLKVGYNRAARMVEEMERIGIVGPQQGSKPRDIIGAGNRY